MPDGVGLHIDHIVPVSKEGKRCQATFKYSVQSATAEKAIEIRPKRICVFYR